MDPLRPFADLVRSLWGTRSGPTPKAESSARVRILTEQQPAARAEATDDLRSRLRTRLGAGGLSDATRAREIFVEVVLTWELGDQVAVDPSFSGVVKAVATRIAERPQLSDRLHELLGALIRE